MTTPSVRRGVKALLAQIEDMAVIGRSERRRRGDCTGIGPATRCHSHGLDATQCEWH